LEKDLTNDQLFDQLAEENPIRVDDIEDGEKSLADYEKENTHLTDLQYLIKTLSPDFRDDVYNALLVSSLSPEVFKPALKILANAEIKRQPPTEQLNVAKQVMKVYTILSIPLDRKHVLDLLEAFGSSKSSSEMDALSSKLGFAG
jgi:hypothetical protein